MVSPHNVLAHVGDLEHLSQLLGVAGEKVQKGEAIKVLGSLITHLNDLVVALSKSLAAKLSPNLSASLFAFAGGLLESKGALHRRLDVTAGESQAESCTGLTDEVQSDLGESLGLEVGDDGSAAKATVTHHLHDLTIPLGGKRQLEASLRRVDTKDTGPGLSIKAEQLILDDSLGIERVVESTDSAGIAGREAVLDVVERGVDEQLRAGAATGADIPGAGLDADSVANAAELLELAVGNDDAVLTEESNLGSVGRPDDALDLGSGDLAEDAAALHFEQDGPVISTEKNTAGGTTIEESINVGVRRLHTLGRLVVEVLNDDLALMSVEDGESVPAEEDGRSHAGATLAIGDGSTGIGEGEGNKLICSTVGFGANQDVALGGVVLVVGEETRGRAYAISLCLLANATE